MSRLFLGVDTSNYTTSLALACDGKVIANVRHLLPVESGKKGLRQSDAVFLHTKALPTLSHELFKNASYDKSELCAVGVSARPRDAEGSYMPCFLAGVSFATAISDALGLPLYDFSHQAGHISAAVYSCGAPSEFDGDFLSFHVSGGTTEALYTKNSDHTYACEIVGGTNDASAGQMIDRAGVMMGLSFPCGKALDELSQASEKNLGKCVSIKNAYFSMSGLENKTAKFLSDGENYSDIAAFLLESIASCLEKSSLFLREKYGNMPILFAGGVMSNGIIRKRLSKINNVYFASPELSCDNACGTALLTYKNHQNRR